jgi:hypothetical protein
VTEKTIRNWLASGRLSAEKSAGMFRIPVGQLEALRAESARNSAGADRHGADSADPDAEVRADGAERSADPGGVAELVVLLARTQAELVQKAEAAAMWQARAEFLAAELDQMKALPAGPETMSNDEIVSAPRPWWRRWLPRGLL